MMANDKTGKEFTFTWRIKNFLSCYQKNGKGIESPVFITKFLHGSKWRMCIFPRGVEEEDKDYFSCFLQNVDLVADKIKIKMTVKIINADKTNLVSKGVCDELTEGECLGFRQFLSREQLLNAIKTWSTDTLNICCILDAVQDSEVDTGCEAITKIGKDRCIFRWNVQFPDSTEWLESKILNFAVTSLLQFDLTAPQDDILMTIIRAKDSKSDCQFINCKITLLDTNGKEVISKSASRLLDCEDKEWKFPSFITKKYLKDKPDILLKDDIFTLLCDFSVSSGIQTEEIKKYTHGASEGNSLKLEEDDLHILQASFRDMFKSKKHTDVKLKTADREFEVHKCVLSTRSPVFSAMFDQGMTESQTGIVKIPDINNETLSSFLEYIYTGTIEGLDSDNASKLLLAADKYQVQPLKNKCLRFIISTLSDIDVCEILITADLINHKQLKSAALDYIKTHAKRILITSEWSNLIKDEPDLATEVLHSLSGNVITS